MKAYLVEARLAYEVQAETADEALRLVSRMVHDDRSASVEYSVRERPELIAPKKPRQDDLHGLTKPVYTLSEVSALLGTSRNTINQRFGSGFVRLGRRVLIPRSKIINILNGESQPDEQPLPVPVRSAAAIRHNVRPKKSTLHEVTPLVQQPRPKKEIKEKDPVSVSEAARVLHISTPRLRELLDQRKIYYTEYYGKRTIPKKAIENFVNGLPAMAIVEENIAYYRANHKLDDEMEEVITKFREQWKSDAD